MIRAVLFDVGGTLHEVHRDPALETTFCAQVLEKLLSRGKQRLLPAFGSSWSCS